MAARRQDTSAARAVRWLTGPFPVIRVQRVLLGALAALGAVLAIVLAAGTPSLRTSDDAEMMAAVSGYDGGARRPELLFTSVLIGRLLVALYDLQPAAPWYGLYLHTLQIVALATIVLSLAVLLRGAPRAVVIAVTGALVLTAANAMMAVQFTIVGILLALSGGLAFLALRTAGRDPVPAAVVGGTLLWAAFLVRVQAFGLGVALLVILVVARALVRRRMDAVGLLTLAAVAAALVAVSLRAETRWWAEEVGEPRPFAVWSSGLATVRSRDAAPGATDGGLELSSNDRELMANWLIWPDRMFAYGPPGSAEPRDAPVEGEPEQAARRGAAMSSTRILETVRVTTVRALGMTDDVILGAWWALLVGALVTAAAPDRRRAAAGSAVLLGGVGLLAVVAATRLPDRVAVPMLLGLVVAAAVATRTPVDMPERGPGVSAPQPPAGRLAALLLVAVVVATPPQVAAVIDLSAEASWRRERATAFLEELALLPGDPTVVLWLIDAWHALHPLGWDQQARYPVDAVQLAGWQFVLPYRAQQREDLGLTDWIGAVADRDDVLLVAEAERVDLLRTLLRERRGRLCTEVDAVGTVRGGRELLIRGIDEVPCQGVVIGP